MPDISLNKRSFADMDAFASNLGDSALQERADELREMVHPGGHSERERGIQAEGRTGTPASLDSSPMARNDHRSIALALQSAWSEHYGPDVSLWPENLRDALETINAGVGFGNFGQNLSSAFQNLRLYEETVPALEVGMAVVRGFSPSPLVGEGWGEGESLIPESAARAGLSFISSPFTLIAPIWAGGIAGRTVTGLTANAGRALSLADEAIAGAATFFGLIGESAAFVATSNVVARFIGPNGGSINGATTFLEETAASTLFFGMLKASGAAGRFVAGMMPRGEAGLALAMLTGHAASVSGLALSEEVQETAGIAPATSTTLYERFWRAFFLHTTINAVNGVMNLEGVQSEYEKIRATAQTIKSMLEAGFAPELVAAMAGRSGANGDILKAILNMAMDDRGPMSGNQHGAEDKGAPEPVETGKGLQFSQVTRAELTKRYRWFITSSGKLVIAGKNSVLNEEIITTRLENGDIILHTKASGSPVVVIKSEGMAISAMDFHEAAVFCASFGKTWNAGDPLIEVHGFKPEQIVKRPEQGVGSFDADGKVLSIDELGFDETLKLEGVKLKTEVQPELVLTLQSDKLRAVPQETIGVGTELLRIMPGDMPKEQVVKLVAERLKKMGMERSEQEIAQALPPGSSKITERIPGQTVNGPQLLVDIVSTATSSQGEDYRKEVGSSAMQNQSKIVDLAEQAKTDPKAVSALRQRAMAGDKAAVSVLKMLDVTTLAKQAKTNIDAVFALRKLARNGNEAAASALKTLDVTTLAGMAKTNPRVIYALSELARNGNKAAASVLRTLDVTTLAGMAKTGPKVIYALCKLAMSGNEAAASVLRTLDVTTLAGMAKTNPKVVSVLYNLAKAENKAAVSALNELAKADRTVVYILCKLARSGNEAAASALKTLDVTTLAEQAKTDLKVVRTLRELARSGNEAAASALKTLDVTTLVEQAKTNLKIVRTLCELAMSENEAAASALRTLDVTAFIDQARTDWRVVYDLRELAMTGNEAALSILANLAGTGNEVALSAVRGLAESGNEAALSAFLVELAKIAPKEVVYIFYRFVDTENEVAASTLRRIVTTLAEPAKTNREVVSILYELAKAGNESATSVLRTLDFTALNDGYYTYTLRDLAKIGNKAALFELVEKAKTSELRAVQFLCDVAKAGNKDAAFALGMLDVTTLTVDALSVLVKAGNEAALSALAERAKTTRRVISVLRELVEHGCTAALSALTELAKTKRVAVNTLRYLAVGNKDALSALTDLANAGNEVALSALRGLAKSGDKAARKALRPWCLRWLGWFEKYN